jgi:hypothetical protein
MADILEKLSCNGSLFVPWEEVLIEKYGHLPQD